MENHHVDVSQSIVWTNARSIVTNSSYGPTETQPEHEANFTSQNVCLLFAKIAAKAGLPCVSIADYDTSEPLGRGLSFDVVGMDIPLGPWYRNSLRQGHPQAAVKRIRVGRIDDEASASRLRSLFHSILLELQILTNPEIRSHENIVSCLAAGYQHFSYDNAYLLPFIVVEYTNQTTLANQDRYPPKTTNKIQAALDRRMDMSHTDRINCLIDVARALRFLHKMNITHGDVKGDNVLVYYNPSEDRYVAKITDFGCAHINDGKATHLPGGTHLWAAPEAQSLIATDLIHKTDIYSYGLLVCSVVLTQDLYAVFALEGDRLEQRRSLDSLKASGKLLEHAERALERNSMSRYKLTELGNIRQVLRCTLQVDPSSRTLETLEDFLHYKHKNKGKHLPHSQSLLPKVQPPYEVDDLSLFLSLDEEGGVLYPSLFFNCEWSVQTYIFRNLYCEWESIVQSPSRRGHAAFQLCICYLNGFGVRLSNTKASEFLAHAVSLDYRYAKHLFYRLQSSFSGSFTPNRETIQWLVEGMSSHGFTRHIAAQDLAVLDMERYMSTKKELYNNVSCFTVEAIQLDFTNLESLQRLIPQLPKPHASVFIGVNNDTLLHCVVASGFVDATLLFINQLEVDLNTRNELGETPLVQACQAGNRQMVELLISKGAKYVPNDDEKTSPLHYLVRFHDEDVGEVAPILAKAGYPIDMNINKLGTPLYWAINRRALRGVFTGLARRNLPAVKALLNLGASINAVYNIDSKGRGVIHRVAQMHNFELLEVLLEAATKSNIEGRQEVISTQRLMSWILNTKSVTSFERILYTGPEINMRLGQTIHLALKYEKDVTSVNRLGENALFFSIANGNSEILRQVLNTKCRAQLEVPSGYHMLRPLQLAVSLSKEDDVEALLMAGADISPTFGNLEETCLHLCSRKSGSVEIAALLMKHYKGSSNEKTEFLNKQRRDGRSPYHLAIYQGHFKLADWYARMGADVEATLYVVTWKHEVNRVLPRGWILGDYHKIPKDILSRILNPELPPRSYICRPVTVLGSLLPYKTEHTMSRLEALFNSRCRPKPSFIVSPQHGLNALHFAVAELYELFEEYQSRISSDTPSLLYDAPLSLVLQQFPSQEEVNHADKNGWTALHVAALNSNVQAVVLLLEAGADPNIVTKSGCTSMDCAYMAKAKWAKWGSFATSALSLIPAYAENTGFLRKRTDAVIEVLDNKGALRKQMKGVLGTMKFKISSREWSFYTYLDPTES